MPKGHLLPALRDGAGAPRDGNHWKSEVEGSDAFVAAPGTVAAWRNRGDVEAVVLHASDVRVASKP